MSQVQEIVERADRQRCKTPAYVFLIGAGASVTSHIPSGEAVLRKLKKEYQVDEKRVEELRNRRMTEYQATMCAIRTNRANGAFEITNYIRDLIERNARRRSPDSRWIINNCHDVIAGILVNCEHFARAVITTNFDPLLNYALLQQWNTEPLLIRHYDEVKSLKPARLQDKFPVILHIHGYWQNHEVYNDLDQFLPWIERWTASLEQSWPSDAIVIGYSGQEDSIAMEWLRCCIRGGRTVWWCRYAPNGHVQEALGNHDVLKNLANSQTPYEKVVDSVNFVPIEGADQFALQLGAALDVPGVKQMKSVADVFPWFKPSEVSSFGNNAKVTLRTRKAARGFRDHDDALEPQICFQMADASESANNHAGINIDSVEREFRMPKAAKAIRLHYVCTRGRSKCSFELKLHSRKNAQRVLVPVKPSADVCRDIPLSHFGEVDMRSIWRIVIAADVDAIKPGGEAWIRIHKTELIDADGRSL